MNDPYEGRYLLHVEYTRRPYEIRLVNLVSHHSQLLTRPQSPTIALQPEHKGNQLVDYVIQASQISDYSQVAHIASAHLSVLPGISLASFLKNRDHGLTQIRTRPKSDLYVTRNVDTTAVHAEMLRFMNAKIYGPAIRNAIFSGLISSFDNVLADTIRICLSYKPDLIREFDTKISYEDILSADDFSAMQRRIVDGIVENILFRSRLYQIQWLEKALGIELQRTLKSWPAFIEACERRNAYVHNNAKVSQQYLDRIKSATGTGPKEEVGSDLSHDAEYLHTASDAMLEMAVLLTQLVARSLIRETSPTPEHLESLDDSYNQAVYDQLRKGRLESSIRLADLYVAGKLQVRDMCAKMVLINAAIAEKKRQKPRRMEQYLSKTDWSSARNEFHIGIASLRENIPEVCRLVPLLKESDLLTPDAYFSWPVFDFVRGDVKVLQTLKNVFGERVGNIAVTGTLSGTELQNGDGADS